MAAHFQVNPERGALLKLLVSVGRSSCSSGRGVLQPETSAFGVLPV